MEIAKVMMNMTYMGGVPWDVKMPLIPFLFGTVSINNTILALKRHWCSRWEHYYSELASVFKIFVERSSISCSHLQIMVSEVSAFSIFS